MEELHANLMFWEVWCGGATCPLHVLGDVGWRSYMLTLCSGSCGVGELHANFMFWEQSFGGATC